MDEAELDEVLDGLVSFVESYVIPLEEKNTELFSNPRLFYNESGSFSQEVRLLKKNVRMKAAEAGFFTMCVPEELGGAGQGPLLHYLTWERLHHLYGPAHDLPYDILAHWARGPSHLFAKASSEVRETVLPRLMSGEQTTCFSLSEPDAGTDSWNLRTSAVRSDGGWLINGTKQWSTNGPSADYAIVFAVTDTESARQRQGGITAFLVPSTSPGYRLDSVVALFGAPGGDEGIISFQDVFVPDAFVLGEVGRGFDLALSGISLGRMYNSGRAVGMSRWAIEQATAYAKTRMTFGKPIAEYQAIQFLLADSAMRVHAAQLVALNCARLLERGAPVRKELAMTKAITTEAAFTALDNCMQVFGGMGFTNELKLYDAWQRARMARVVDGSAEIMRRNIAKCLLRGDFAL